MKFLGVVNVGGANNFVDVAEMPSMQVITSRIILNNAGWGYSGFASDISVAAGVGDQSQRPMSAHRFTVVDIAGRGKFFGAVLPLLPQNGVVHLIVTVDGVESSQAYTYSPTQNGKHIIVGDFNNSHTANLFNVNIPPFQYLPNHFKGIPFKSTLKVELDVKNAATTAANSYFSLHYHLDKKVL
jgi:hypothetical protein